MIDRQLLHDVLQVYPAQPATAVWRAVEIGAILNVGIPEGRGLDLGCGDGKLTALIVKRTGARHLVGIDNDPLETQVARECGIYEAVHTGSASHIPEDDQSFDYVISNSVLEHIPELEPVLRDIARVLRRGGRFFFTVPGPSFHSNLQGSLLPWVSRSQYLEDLDRRLAHFRYPTSIGWNAMCRGAGLSVAQCLGYLNRRETRTWETISRFTGGALYAVWGKRKSPITIQRNLGLRQVQNSFHLPSIVTALLGSVISARLANQQGDWLPESTASCLLVDGYKP